MGRNKIKIQKIDNERIRQVNIGKINIIKLLRSHFIREREDLSKNRWSYLYSAKLKSFFALLTKMTN